ncbi:MAG: DegT/DnrJ/EryC1/StrS family aminotransferase [Ferruginibacter sp.]|nr:DegT/DnrJ/EryC1/StrS family aminotransferase [Ferruginibacter sp.]
MAINVTKTYLPPFEEYTAILKRAWDKAWITNNGILVEELEQKLKEYLGVKHLLYCSNGMIVLQMALKVLNITGEVITTPFSYVATTNAIIWEGCTPVFVDIERSDLTIDADKIEAAITEKTQAILATHVYGFPCNIEKIQSIAQKHHLKVIYDAAHTFGGTYNQKAIMQYGDISTCSFHATKVFHTVEGGCIITNDDEIARQLVLFRSFGHVGDDYYSVGINAKNSEFHAAMGLCVFNHFDEILYGRKQAADYYDKLLTGISKPAIRNNSSWNYAYYPVIFKSNEELLQVRQALAEQQIFSRRYFYPSLNQLPFIKRHFSCPISENISTRILSLPLYDSLLKKDIEIICKIINKVTG